MLLDPQDAENQSEDGILLNFKPPLFERNCTKDHA